MKSGETFRFKGLVGISRSTDEIRSDDKTVGPYYRWWRLMQLSRAFWFAKANNCPIVDPDVENTFNMIGDIHNQSFDVWWKQTGQQIFSEIDEFAKVREIDLANFDQSDRYRRSVIIEVPLTSTAKQLTNEFKIILKSKLTNETDESRRFNVMAYSTAQLKLLRKNINHEILDREYFSLLYRILYPNTRVWAIGDRLKLVPSIEVQTRLRRSVEPSIKVKFKTLQAVTGRCIYRARYACFHMERGSFPNYSKVTDWGEIIPFDEQEHQHFRDETYEDDRINRYFDRSIWQEWLRNTHLVELKEYVTKVNKFYLNHDIKSIQYDNELERYLEGKDCLNGPSLERQRAAKLAKETFDINYR
jgi:hypothetical protein